MSYDKFIFNRGVGMFGLFKKKKTQKVEISQMTTNPMHQLVLKQTAEVLRLQFNLCTADPQKFSRLIESNYGRGYLAGFIDSAFTEIGFQATHGAVLMGQFAMLQAVLFNVDMDTCLEYASISVNLYMDNEPEFVRGLNIGGQEYLDFYNQKIPHCRGLISYFHDELK